MVYTLAAALLLVQGALATLPPFPAPNALAAVQHAASTTDAGLLACATAEAIESYCVNYYDDFTDLPAPTQAACLCCLDSSNVGETYGSCADYISASFMRSYSSEYTLQSAVEEVCQAAGANICRGGAATATATSTSTRRTSVVASATLLSSARGSATGSGSSRATTTAVVVDQEPPACTSAAYIIESCSAKVDDFTDLPGSSQASCICSPRSSYTTLFDGYVQDCASYVKTASPAYYSDWAALTTFCEDYPARTTAAAGSQSSSQATRTTTPSTTSPVTQTVTVQAGGGSGATTSTTSSARGTNGAPGREVGALGNLIMFIVSLFVAI